MEKKIEDFRNWMRETHGIQDAQDYEGTMSEDFAIVYAERAHNAALDMAIKRINEHGLLLTTFEDNVKPDIIAYLEQLKIKQP